MGYNPATDFIGLLRDTGNGVREVRMPGLDWLVNMMAHANMFNLWVHPTTAPTANMTTTVWLRPSSSAGSYAAESTVMLYNSATNTYQTATPALWKALFNAQG